MSRKQNLLPKTCVGHAKIPQRNCNYQAITKQLPSNSQPLNTSWRQRKTSLPALKASLLACFPENFSKRKNHTSHKQPCIYSFHAGKAIDASSENSRPFLEIPKTTARFQKTPLYQKNCCCIWRKLCCTRKTVTSRGYASHQLSSLEIQLFTNFRGRRTVYLVFDILFKEKEGVELCFFAL